MAAERHASGLVHILVAVIGVVGSLGVAWITTQAKFSQELDSRAGEVTALRSRLEEAEQRLGRQQQEMDRKVAAVDERLRRLDAQIELAQTAARGLLKVSGGLIGGKK